MISPSRALLLRAARLYPKAWRERYGDEFAAMIEDLPEGRARWAAVADILRGALVMRARRTVTGMAVTGALAGVLIATGVGLAIPNQYYTVALLRAESGMTDEMLSAAVERMIEAGKQHGDAERIDRDVQVVFMHRRADGSRHVRVGFADRRPERAQQVTKALTKVLLANESGLSLVDAPALPQTPIFPNRTNIGLLGLQLGLALGLLAAFAQPKAQRM